MSGLELGLHNSQNSMLSHHPGNAVWSEKEELNCLSL